MSSASLDTTTPASAAPATAPPATPHKPLSRRVLACLGATWLVWGSTYLAIKFALLSLPPFVQMGSRFLTAGVILAVWMRWRRGAAWPTARQWLHALVIGSLMLGGGMGGTAVAEQTVGSGLVVAFIAVSPLMIAALNLLWRVVPSRLELAGIALGLVGVLLLTQGQGFGASPGGLAAILTATVCWATGSVLSQRLLPLAPGPMGFASEMLAGGAVLMLISLLQGEAVRLPLQPQAAAAWLYLVVFGSLIAFNAYMVLLAETPAAVASSYSFVNPVIAMLLGVGLAGEQISGHEWLAAGVVLGGVVLLLTGRRQR
jgi:drug/metabolite transporter (DMT)-like permease